MNTPPGQIICPRTPSTPRFGANFDTPSKGSPSTRKQPPRGGRSNTTSSKHSSSTLSPPPSSPIGQSPSPRRSPRNVKKARFAEDEKLPGVEEEDEGEEGGPSSRKTVMGSHGLATPAKTPRKRKLPQADIASSSKVLFPSSAPPAAPRTPSRKTFPSSTSKTVTPRHRKRPSGTVLDDVSSSIEIYTDSDARRPKEDTDPDNPFISRPGDNLRSSKRKRQQGADAENRLGEHAHRTDGMYVVFRGKKIFQKFENAPDREDRAGSDDADGLDPASIKPRLLFPSSSTRRRNAPDDENTPVTKATSTNDEDINEDEEAETDIDETAPSQSSQIIVKSTTTTTTTTTKRRVRHTTPEDQIIVSASPRKSSKRHAPKRHASKRHVSRMTPDESDDEIIVRNRDSGFVSGSRSKKSTKVRLSASKALLDEGEDEAIELSSSKRRLFEIDEEETTKSKGKKRSREVTGLETPMKTPSRKRRAAAHV